MGKPRTEPVPVERTQTKRQALLDHLEAGPLGARELAGLVRIREREVEQHLSHLEKSLRRGSRRLRIIPAQCQSCGFVFEKRSRLTKPGACPRCRGQRIEAPAFALESVGQDRG